MLKNLPDSFVELLTELFNRSVIESAIPSEWNKAIVIPLLKAGKTLSWLIPTAPYLSLLVLQN